MHSSKPNHDVHHFRQPATEAQLEVAEKELGQKLPATVRLNYLLHDGQNLDCDQSFPKLLPSQSMFHGVPGGLVNQPPEMFIPCFLALVASLLVTWLLTRLSVYPACRYLCAIQHLQS